MAVIGNSAVKKGRDPEEAAQESAKKYIEELMTVDEMLDEFTL